MLVEVYEILPNEKMSGARIVRRSERGATMLEFAMAAMVFFGLLSGLIDLGLGIHRYVILTHATSKAAREVAAKMSAQKILNSGGTQICTCNSTPDNCTTPPEEIINKYINERLSLNLSDIVVKGNLAYMDNSPINNPCLTMVPPMTLTVTARYEFRCIMCTFVNRTIPIVARAEQIVENRCYCSP